MKRIGGLFALMFTMGFLVWPAGAPAGVHQVWDEAHAFKLETLQQADRIVGQIHERFGKDLMVETFASIPDDLKPAYQQQGKEKFFEGWSNTEGHDLQVNGVVILITQDPPHVQVAVGQDTRRRAFTLDDRDELVEKLVAVFEKRELDKGLIDAAEFIRDRMARNLAAAGAASRPATQPSAAPARESDATPRPRTGDRP